MLQENIKNFRKERGLTQEELAIRLNVVRQTVSKWEKGLSVPDADMLQRLAEVLEVTVNQLLGEEREPERNRNEIAEQLARINEQLAIRNRRSRRIWTVVGVVLGLWLLLHTAAMVLSYAAYDNITELTVSEAVEVLEDESGNVLIIEKTED
ncbi:MAG: helix-turn-helix transcriptional regulator [Oscillospiraceae bacterium]|nr:helix-turn-helix transcriptional regulator [Oscillospiraceae bacterium]